MSTSENDYLTTSTSKTNANSVEAEQPINFNFDHFYEKVSFSEPILLHSEVIHGFKRGSKELGVPTANLAMPQLGQLGEDLKTGVYYGWCKLREEVYQTVVSVGWNPFYKNTLKTVEAHLLHELEDFYGESITVMLCGYLRDEKNFSCLEELIAIIQNDIMLTREHLAETDQSNKYNEWRMSLTP